MGIANLREAVRRLVCCFADTAVLLLCVASHSSAATSPVGAIPGSHQVTPTGAFTYTIPIAVPPGTAGMQPNLSLTYNSQSGNGLLGMGWSLSGLSVIHRCPQTYAQDGTKGGISLDANDRYCLDGQRLIAVTGSYGGASTEYRTETESYSRIVSYGSQGTGPAYWKVWSKSGQIMEYGVTADSRIEAQGKTEVLLWALNRVSDTVGNYLTVTYTEDNANGQYYPSRIDYTGNANTGKAPTNSIQFSYEARPDIVPLYQAGSLTKNTVRMTEVRTYVGAGLVHEYQLAYGQSVATQRSLVISATECAGDGTCLPSVVMGWQGVTNSLTGQGSDTVAPRDNATLVVADVNSDGKGDLIYQPKSTGGLCQGSRPALLLSNGVGFEPKQCLGFDSPSTSAVLKIGDFNSDGKADLVYQPLTTGGICGARPAVFTANETGFGTMQCLGFDVGAGSGFTYYPDLLIGDVNGDGRSDVVVQPATGNEGGLCPNSGGPSTFISNGSGFSAVQCSGIYAGAYYGRLVAADVSGDGKADLLWQQRTPRIGFPPCSASQNAVFRSNGAGFGGAQCLGFVAYPLDTTFAPSYYSQVIAVDVNGDGMSDIVVQPYAAGGPVNLCPGAQPALFLSTGKGVSPIQCLGFDAGYSSSTLAVADVNGDGKADLIYQGNSGGGLCGAGQAAVLFSNGNGFNTAQCLGFDANKDSVTLIVGDLNGDGRSDLLYQPSSSTGTFGPGKLGVSLS